MGAIAAATVGAAAIGGLSSYFGSRSNAAAMKKAAKDDFRSQRYFVDQARRDALEARNYKEKAIGAYRQFGTSGLAAPAYTDYESIKPVDPYAGK